MEPLKDYSWLRGVNHGINDEATTRKYLGYGKRVNLNATRFLLSFDAWVKDRDNYFESVRNYIRTCYDCGYRVMPILLNGNGFKAESLEDEQMKRLDEYVIDVVNEFKDEEGLLMWDIMNEPTYNPLLLEKDLSTEERERRVGLIMDFLRHYCHLVKKVDSKNATTVGHHTA